MRRAFAIFFGVLALLIAFSQEESIPSRYDLIDHTGELERVIGTVGKSRTGIIFTLKGNSEKFLYSPHAGDNKHVVNLIKKSNGTISILTGEKKYRPSKYHEGSKEVYEITIDGKTIRTYDEIQRGYNFQRYFVMGIGVFSILISLFIRK
ncbi:hypothetical protein [Neptunomonas sp. XY-337]|uniref:hypothetical protein n=1 Tax=Neptunomonas sp. XY-337 TaxID=2561897 RepID=UPI0010AB3EEF|nr:hypothetical protein [Neptunomonas sp. XY-337]